MENKTSSYNEKKQDETQFNRMTFDDNRESMHVLLYLYRSYFHSLSHYLSFRFLSLSLSLSQCVLISPLSPLPPSLSIYLYLFLSVCLSLPCFLSGLSLSLCSCFSFAYLYIINMPSKHDSRNSMGKYHFNSRRT